MPVPLQCLWHQEMKNWVRPQNGIATLRDCPHGPWCFHVFSHSGSMSIVRQLVVIIYIYTYRKRKREYTQQIWFHFIFLSNAWLVHRASIWNHWPELFIWSLNCSYPPTLNIRKTTWESKKPFDGFLWFPAAFPRKPRGKACSLIPMFVSIQRKQFLVSHQSS